jgi:hypothetical protein
MSKSFPLPTEPEAVIPSLIERFNSGEFDAITALYAVEAVFIANDGEPSLNAPRSLPNSSAI